MASITFAVDEEFKSEISNFAWINLSELVREEIKRRHELFNKLKSREEQEFIKWSIELGRKSKKESFKKLLAKLSKEEREELLRQ